MHRRHLKFPTKNPLHTLFKAVLLPPPPFVWLSLESSWDPAIENAIDETRFPDATLPLNSAVKAVSRRVIFMVVLS
jgi:hypothetical protein